MSPLKTDILAVLHAFEFDAGQRGVGLAARGLQVTVVADRTVARMSDFVLRLVKWLAHEDLADGVVRANLPVRTGEALDLDRLVAPLCCDPGIGASWAPPHERSETPTAGSRAVEATTTRGIEFGAVR